MEKIFKITLSDGTQLENLRVNGNNFVSATKITENTFKGKLSKVKIESENFNQEYSNMELVQITHYDDGYYFILRKISQEELDKLKTKADIEYLAMMTDIDLEEA